MARLAVCYVASVAVLVLALLFWARGAEAPLASAPPTHPQPFDLASTARRLIRAAASPSEFASVAKRGSAVTRLFEVPPFPSQYEVYRAVTTQPDVRFYVASADATDKFAIVPTGGSTLAHEGYQSPVDWLARVVQVIAPDLGAGYTKEILHNGTIFFARGKPTVEFFFVEGISSESATQRGYNMYMLVFRPQAAVLELIGAHWVKVRLHS
jgi:hypothetical protein